MQPSTPWMTVRAPTFWPLWMCPYSSPSAHRRGQHQRRRTGRAVRLAQPRRSLDRQLPVDDQGAEPLEQHAQGDQRRQDHLHLDHGVEAEGRGPVGRRVVHAAEDAGQDGDRRAGREGDERDGHALGRLRRRLGHGSRMVPRGPVGNPRGRLDGLDERWAGWVAGRSVRWDSTTVGQRNP
jgi:hypothetical protein